MLTHLEKGDVAETVSEFFEKSKTVKPSSKSTLSLQNVDEYLIQLSKLTKEDDQQRHLKTVAQRYSNFLFMLLILTLSCKKFKYCNLVFDG